MFSYMKKIFKLKSQLIGGIFLALGFILIPVVLDLFNNQLESLLSYFLLLIMVLLSLAGLIFVLVPTTETSAEKLLSKENLPFHEIKSTDGVANNVINNIDNPKSHGIYHPFARMHDILGDEKKEFVRGLSEIFDIDIVEEDESRIRIVFTEKNCAYHTLEEMQKTYADFVALLNSMKKRIEIIPVYHEITMGNMGSDMSFDSKQVTSKTKRQESELL